MAANRAPKESRATLDPKANTIAIANGMLFDYYSIKLGERVGPFVTLLNLPPVIPEEAAFVTISRKIYKLTPKDYIRRRVNVSNPYNPRANATNAVNSTTSAESCGGTGESTSASNRGHDLSRHNLHSDQQGSGGSTEAEEIKLANLAWLDQIETLQYIDD